MAKRSRRLRTWRPLEKAANEAAAGQAGAPAVAGSTKALVPGSVKKSKLAPLVAEQSAGAPLHGTTSNLWWHAGGAVLHPRRALCSRCSGRRRPTRRRRCSSGRWRFYLKGDRRATSSSTPPRRRSPLSAAEDAPTTEARRRTPLDPSRHRRLRTVADAVRADRRAASRAPRTAPPPVAVGGAADFEPPPLAGSRCRSSRRSRAASSTRGGGATPRALQGDGGAGDRGRSRRASGGERSLPRLEDRKKPATPATRAAAGHAFDAVDAAPPARWRKVGGAARPADGVPAMDAAPRDPELSPEGAVDRIGWSSTSRRRRRLGARAAAAALRAPRPPRTTGVRDRPRRRRASCCSSRETPLDSAARGVSRAARSQAHRRADPTTSRCSST